MARKGNLRPDHTLVYVIQRLSERLTPPDQTEDATSKRQCTRPAEGKQEEEEAKSLAG